MITVRVIGKAGWQNADKLIPEGELRDLVCEEKDISAYIEAGILEVVNPSVEEPKEDPEKKQAELIEMAVTASLNAYQKLNPATVPVQIKDRSDDDASGGFNGLADFALAVYKADKPGASYSPAAKRINEWDEKCARVKKFEIKDPTNKTTGHMAEFDGEQGGHLVPAEFMPSLLQNALEGSIVRPRAMQVPMQTNSIGFPVMADYDHRPAGNGLFGAILIKRPGEAEQKDPSKPKFEKVTLTLHKMTLLTFVSDEPLSLAA